MSFNCRKYYKVEYVKESNLLYKRYSKLLFTFITYGSLVEDTDQRISKLIPLVMPSRDQ